MDKLHLVGFTADLKNLVLAKRKGAKTGSFLIEIDARLRTALQEIEKIEDEQTAVLIEEEEKAAAQASQLTPKEIQNQLRKGKSVEEVARLADTSPSWVERFNAPIVAERAGVVDTVRRSRVVKARKGPSDYPVGQAIESNLKDKGVPTTPEVLEDGWDAVKRNEHWEVSFAYTSRGQKKVAKFAFDPEARHIESTNTTANQIAWRSTEDDESSNSKSPKSPRAKSSSSAAKKKSGRKKKTSRKRKSPKKKAKRKTTKRKPAKKKAKRKPGKKTRRKSR